MAKFIGRDKLQIKKANRSNANAIVKMASQLSTYEGNPSQFRKKHYLVDGFGRNRRFETIIALIGNKIVGYATFHLGYDIQSASAGFYLIDLFVLDRYRGDGVGIELIKAISRKCIEMNGQWISWHVSGSNLKAIAFYKKLNAQKTSSFQYVLEKPFLISLSKSELL